VKIVKIDDEYVPDDDWKRQVPPVPKCCLKNQNQKELETFTSE
jgi:hypothetical protein